MGLADDDCHQSTIGCISLFKNFFFHKALGSHIDIMLNVCKMAMLLYRSLKQMTV